MKDRHEIQAWLKANLHKLDNPCGYIGDEPNTYQYTEGQWTTASLRSVICAPYTYYDWTGNPAMQLIYELVNDAKPSWIMERAMLPSTPREARLLEKAEIPTFSLESKEPISGFDVVGFSVNWMPQNANVVDMMRRSGMPIRWRDRLESQYPLIMTGAMAAMNPYSIAPVADIVWLGEVEDEVDNPGIVAVFSDIGTSLREGGYYTQKGREELLHKLAKDYDFLYVPRFIKTRRHGRIIGSDYGRIVGWDYEYDDIPKNPKRRIVKDLDAVPALKRGITFYDGDDLGARVEVSRGCPGSCLFCASRVWFAPFRVRSVDTLVAAFREGIHNSGSSFLAPISLEFGDYPHKKELLKRLMEEVSGEIASLPLRIDQWANDPEFAQIFAKAKLARVTLAVEGANQRMRTAVSKGIDEQDVLRAVRNAIAAGHKTLKLYMIVDLPGEKLEDTLAILDLAKKIDDLRRSLSSKIRIRISWSPANIQAWTPLQWGAPVMDQKTLAGVFRPLKQMNFVPVLGKKKFAGLRYFTQLSELADSRAGEAIVDALEEMGCSYRGGLPEKIIETLERHLAARGLGFVDYFCEKPADFVFDWDVFDMLVTKEYLFRTYTHMQDYLKGDYVPERTGFLGKFGKCNDGCDVCGACPAVKERKAMQKMLNEEDTIVMPLHPLDEFSVAEKYRFRVNIDPDYRYVVNNHWRMAVRRACYLAGLPVTKGSVTFGSDELKSRNWIAGVDSMTIAFTRPVGMGIDALAYYINANMNGMQLLDGKISNGAKDSEVNYYIMELADCAEAAEAAIAHWLSGEVINVQLKIKSFRGGFDKLILNLQDYLDDAWVSRAGDRLFLHAIVKGKISPYDVYSALFRVKIRAKIFRFPAMKVDTLFDSDDLQVDFFKSVCTVCGRNLPTNILGHTVGEERCLKCEIEVKGDMVACKEDECCTY